MFEASGEYERFMGRWSRRLAPAFVDFTAVGDGDSVLDLGSGTGSFALAVAEAFPNARVTAIDPSSAYLAAAQKRAPNHRVRFAVGNAQALELPSGRFDTTLSMLAMNFFPEPDAALREMIRVTRPGGIVAASVWDYREGMEMLRRFWDAAVALDPSIEARDERHMPLCRPWELSLLWRGNGLDRVEEQAIAIELPFTSFDDYWTPFLDGQGPAGVYATSLSDANRDALAARLRDRLAGTSLDRSFTLHARAWAVKGVVPA